MQVMKITNRCLDVNANVKTLSDTNKRMLLLELLRQLSISDDNNRTRVK